MITRRLLTLEPWWLVLTVIFPVISIFTYLKYPPPLLLMFAAGVAAVFAVFAPRMVKLVLLLAGTLFLGGEWAYGIFFNPVIAYFDTLTADMVGWMESYRYPGVHLSSAMGISAVFLLVYLQLIMSRRLASGIPLLILGILVYTWLWSRGYPYVETDTILFLVLAFPASTFLHMSHRSSLPRIFYQGVILRRAILCAAVVFILPTHLSIHLTPGQWGWVAGPFVEEEPGEPEDPDPERETESPEREGLAGYGRGDELGGGVIDSTEPVMELDLEEGSAPEIWYLRGRSADYYTGRTWKTRHSKPVESMKEAFSHVPFLEEEVELSVTYLAPEKDLMGLFPTNNIRFNNGEEPPASENEEYQVDIQGNITSKEEDLLSYTVSGEMATTWEKSKVEAFSEDLEKASEELEPFLQVPEDLPERVVKLSQEIAQGADTDEETMEQILDYLREFPYNARTQAPPEGEDFVDHFLFELREGYCAHYASAATLLMRLQEIPSRYVLGYRVSPFAEEQERYEMEEGLDEPEIELQEDMTFEERKVLRNDAHAWVEVFLEGHGWTTLEPTRPYQVRFEPYEEEGDEIQEVEEEREVDPVPGVGNNDTEFILYAGVGMPVLVAFLLAGSFLLVKVDLGLSGSPGELYYRLIKVKSAFVKPPLPAETPEQIIEQLKNSLPGMSDELDKLKHLYHLAFFSPENYSEGLRGVPQNLPLMVARGYKEKYGLVKYLKVTLVLFTWLIREKVTPKIKNIVVLVLISSRPAGC